MADKKAARDFVEEWTGKGNENQHRQLFWISFLQNIFHVDIYKKNKNRAAEYAFEVKVKTESGKTDYKDAVFNRYTDSEVLVEQKSLKIPLDKKLKNSDGVFRTAFEQAKHYDYLTSRKERARWIITCNFAEFWIYDMNKEGSDRYVPDKVLLSELPEKLDHFSFLEPDESSRAETHDYTKETDVSVDAGRLVALMYQALEKQYHHDENGKLSLKQTQDLNRLCVRIVFCLYAEDSGLFHPHQFHDYMDSFKTQRMASALSELFKVLETKEEDRTFLYLENDLAAFPYVNGGLFSGAIEIPMFTEEIRDVLIHKESEGFNWSVISPTVFGAAFESTLNPDTRHEGGMHYTSIEYIHRVIDPLFLDDLTNELNRLLLSETTTKNALLKYQKKLASLRFFDPACGSGNFLTETYLCLRRLENIVIARLKRGQMTADWEDEKSLVKVSINQFFGIEINDFAVSVATTALWIAEHEMYKETAKIMDIHHDFLPLHTYTNIHEGDALTADWNDVLPSSQANYVIGNPPFLGKKEQSREQKTQIMNLFHDCSGAGNLDFVSGWYMKAIKYIAGTKIHCAFVSTNSITQGEQAPVLWKALFDKGLVINYAWHTFKWNNEAAKKAQVHVVIIGFSYGDDGRQKIIYDKNGTAHRVDHINENLADAPYIGLQSRSVPLCDVKPMIYGSMPIDDGHLILDQSDVDALLKENPQNSRYIRRYAGGVEIINETPRWCLWLQGANPSDLRKSAFIRDRVRAVREYRISSHRRQTVKAADTPTLFGEIRQPDITMLAMPKVSSKTRDYIPITFVEPDVIINGSALIIPGADLYTFGILMSSVHNDWMRLTAGRMKSDYQYSASIVYNNFIWPSPSSEQKHRIEKTAQAILDARKSHPNETLADLYDKDFMPTDLLNAHKANDRTVMEAYGFSTDSTEKEIDLKMIDLYHKRIQLNG